MNDPNAISYYSQKVFISYSHDSLEHADWVASFANDLRGAGVEANIDQFVTGAYPDEGWDTWMFRQIREADYVLCICTETYKRRAEGDEEPGKGFGVSWEGSIIRKRIYDQEEVSKKKFNAVLPPGSNKSHIPYFLPIHYFQMPDGRDTLFRLFQNLPQVQPAPVNPKLYVPPVGTKTSEISQPQLSDIGRSRELQQLSDFWNNPAKSIFTFYGLAQMGKSFTIEKWSENNLAPDQILRITLTEDLLPQAIACDIIFGEKEMPETHRLTQAITERFQQKTLVWFENMELALELKPGQESHSLREQALHVLLKTLSANSNIKVILECRYVIDLQVLDPRSTGLKETQLHKIAPDYFREQYHQFTTDEYHLIYEKTGGNTWLLLNIPRTFKKLFFNKGAFLADIGASTLFETYRETYLKLLLDILDNTEAALICRLVFTYKPRPVTEFVPIQPDPALLEQAFQSLYDKLLILPDAENLRFSISGYVREACRLHFKDKPAMQEALMEQQAKTGRKFRIEESAKDRLDKYSFLIKEVPGFVRFHIEIAKAYFEIGDKIKSWTALLDTQNIAQTTEEKIDVFNAIFHIADYQSAKQWFEEMRQMGLMPNEVSYNTLENKSPNYATAKQWFEEMIQMGLTPDEVSYNTLANKSSDYPIAKQWFEEMIQMGLTPNEISYSTLINKSPDYPTAKQWFEEMKQKGVTPNEVSYNTLINKSPDYPTAKQWFEEMKQKGLTPYEFSYNPLITKSPDYATAKQWFEEMKQKGLTPTTISYNMLIIKSPDYITTKQWFEEMKQKGLTPNEILYSTLINKSPDYPTSKQWFEEMKQKGLTPNEILYSTLINKSPDYPTAKQWFEEMKQKGVTPNEVSYNTLINKSPDYSTAMQWFEEMQQKGLTPNEFSYNTLINKSTDFPTARKWFEEMQQKGLAPNEFSYNPLINKIPDYTTAKQWFGEMQQKGLTPNEFSYIPLINKSPDYSTAKQWFEEMKQKGLTPDEFSYNPLISKSPDYPTSKQWLEEMKQKGLTPDEFSYNTLINKSPDYDTTKEWFEEMKEKGMAPYAFSYNTLINKSPDYSTTKQWFEEMKQKGLTPDEYSYSTLVNKSPDYHTAKEWFEEMKIMNVSPNVFTFNTLLKMCRSWTQAFPLLEDMQKLNILPQLKPKTYTFFALESLIKRNPGSLSELSAWLQKHPPHDEVWKQLFQELLAMKTSQYYHSPPTPPPVQKMDLSTLRQKLQDHIANSRLKEAFKLLKKERTSDNMLTMLESRWSKLREDEIKGILSQVESTLQRNQINDGLLNYLDGLDLE